MQPPQTGKFPFASGFEFDFPSRELALVAYRSLILDEELQPDKVVREIHVDGFTFKATFRCMDPRLLRTVVAGFFDMFNLVLQTISVFGQEVMAST
eukprot:ANDGO_08640.mRNA.1 hypothetical protein GUITHDRAFT_152857